MSYLPPDIDPLAMKTKFAEASLRHPTQPFKAAMMVFPQHIQAAMFVSQEWLHDEFVLAEKDRLLAEHGPDHYLPSKYELAHEVYALASNAQVTEDKIKGFELYAKIQGLIAKAPTTTINVDNSRKVLMVSPSDPVAVAARQAKLLRDMAEDAT